MLLGLLVNITLLAILTAWFFWWRRASRNIESFKQARAEMGQLMAQLQEQLAMAHQDIAQAATVAQDTLPELREAIRRSDELLLELRGVCAVGDRVAERIEEVTRQARMLQQATVAAAGRPTPARRAKETADLSEAALDAPVEAAQDTATRPRARAPRKLFRGRPGAAAAEAGNALGGTASS